MGQSLRGVGRDQIRAARAVEDTSRLESTSGEVTLSEVLPPERAYELRLPRQEAPSASPSGSPRAVT